MLSKQWVTELRIPYRRVPGKLEDTFCKDLNELIWQENCPCDQEGMKIKFYKKEEKNCSGNSTNPVQERKYECRKFESVMRKIETE